MVHEDSKKSMADDSGRDGGRLWRGLGGGLWWGLQKPAWQDDSGGDGGRIWRGRRTTLAGPRLWRGRRATLAGKAGDPGGDDDSDSAEGGRLWRGVGGRLWRRGLGGRGGLGGRPWRRRGGRPIEHPTVQQGSNRLEGTISVRCADSAPHGLDALFIKQYCGRKHAVDELVVKQTCKFQQDTCSRFPPPHQLPMPLHILKHWPHPLSCSSPQNDF